MHARRVFREELGACKLSTRSHRAVRASKEVAYASTAALHVSNVVWVQRATLMCLTSWLKCRSAKGQDSAHVAK